LFYLFLGIQIVGVLPGAEFWYFKEFQKDFALDRLPKW